MTQIHQFGNCGISAKIIKDSINKYGNRITTFELEYPRLILSEVNTHKMLSKNSASSRAIPISAMHDHIRANTATPVHWGQNQSGMSARAEVDELTKGHAKTIWDGGRDIAIAISKMLSMLGIHKQIANRVTEPWMMMKTVLTGTEFENLWWLRDHDDAQPEFHELAHCMHVAYSLSTPEVLYSNEWHLPYIDTERVDGRLIYSVHGKEVDLETAKKISASCCAQVSYRKNDDSEEKADIIFDRLINSTPMHASPVEHQARPIPAPHGSQMLIDEIDKWEQLGITHMRHDKTFWSANFKGWCQYRQMLPNHTKW